MGKAIGGSTKLVSDITGLAMKTTEGSVAFAGKAIDTGLAIGTGAVDAVKDVGVAATGAVGSVGKSALTEAGQVGVTTLEGTGKTLRAAEDAVFNTSTRLLKGVDAMTRIAAGSGANVAARIETSQAATATAIAARAPNKVRDELRGVFKEVTKDMQDLVRIVSKTQMANLQLQIGTFKNVYCYGFSGFFKKYFSTHPCPRQRPPNTADMDIQQMKIFTQNLEGRLKTLAKSFETALVAASDAQNAYPSVVEKFRTEAAKFVDELTAKYALVIQKYTDLNEKFFAPALAAPTPAPEPAPAQPAVGQGRKTRRAGRRTNPIHRPRPRPPPRPQPQPAPPSGGRRYTRRPKKASKGPLRFLRKSF